MFTNDVIASFNELEMSLYNYINLNSDKVIYMRIRDLADESHVSTTSILRFCKKVNCEGFSEFKVKLKLYLEENQATNIKSPQHSLTEFIERTMNANFQSIVSEAASLISQSRNVIFVGIGASGILAEFGARYFSSMGKFSLHIKDPHFPIETDYLHNSTTISLSVSGETLSTLNHINKLKKEGSKIISITNNKINTIAKISDVNIPYFVTEERMKTSNITTSLPVVYILESLAREVYNLSKNKC
ncbi:MurR/RpiR family transcriptional regulator [Neobacillus cucumis]|uniref:MurR/RpiR family transcriptional regulator n=1 Tax=Neobacillus cucumis TaxID=1740721 RepID=UPI0028532864|nr:MurR/RpiR family transcriptional regulator [Neobacillus cucumis]MDR4946623.1 MurR/RpiR family transcriptional regulator [Neobacillus cucumis]